jgi:hypothetical protein
VRAELLAAGGPELWREFMAELRTIHLGEPAPERDGPSVMERLAKALRRRTLMSYVDLPVSPRIRVRPCAGRLVLCGLRQASGDPADDCLPGRTTNPLPGHPPGQ